MPIRGSFRIRENDANGAFDIGFCFVLFFSSDIAGVVAGAQRSAVGDARPAVLALARTLLHLDAQLPALLQEGLRGVRPDPNGQLLVQS